VQKKNDLLRTQAHRRLKARSDLSDPSYVQQTDNVSD